MLYIVGNCPIDSKPIFLYLIAKLHIFSDISINYSYQFHFSPYFFIFRYSVAGLIFSIAAACSRCPLQTFRALIMLSFSIDSSLRGRTVREGASSFTHGRISISNASIFSIGVSRDQYGTFDSVLQLPHVARPVIGEHPAPGIVRKALRFPFQFFGMTFTEKFADTGRREL